MNTSRIAAEFVSGLKTENIPEDVINNVNVRIVDLVAAAAAGRKMNAAMNEVVLKTLLMQGGEAQSSLLFEKTKTSAALAAFYNAFVVSGAEMDDGHMLANGHPGVVTIPPVLALAQWRNSSYEDAVAAIAAGYEIYIRLSNVVMPSHLQRGFYGTGTVGTIAAAAASARVLKLDAEKTHNAIGIAVTSAAGIMTFNESGQEMKPINPANAAYKGVMCALLAENGAVGSDDPFDGSKGFFNAFADKTNPAELTEGLGGDFLLDTSYIKLYPACRHLHAMVDCGVKLHDSGDFELEDVEEIILYTYPNSAKLTGSIRHPATPVEAKFSLTYASALALMQANFTLEDIEAAVEKEAEASALIDKMRMEVDTELENRAKRIRGARMEIRMRDGRVLHSCVDVPKGEKAFPITEEDLRKKFEACSNGVLPADVQKKTFDALLNLGQTEELESIFALIASKE